MKTDNAIAQFTQAFVDLKDKFRAGMDVESWKIAVNVHDGVLQLTSTVERMEQIGTSPLSVYPHAPLTSRLGS